MNSHLNVFRFYTATDREYQLENDITRALAICLQENPIMLYVLLKDILSADHFRKTFSVEADTSKVAIDIQQSVSGLDGFSHLYAVSVSGHAMDCNGFFTEKPSTDSSYQPITDMVVTIGDFTIIFEVKPHDENCRAQLYQQAEKAVSFNGMEMEDTTVTPVDLNWRKLMDSTSHVSSFQSLSGMNNRLVKDFIDLIKKHNHTWMPINALTFLSASDHNLIGQRLNHALTHTEAQPLESSGRKGLRLEVPWADELLFDYESGSDKNFLRVKVFPGNTKGQGWSLYQKPEGPKFKEAVTVGGGSYQVQQEVHLKFSHFQKYIAELTFDESNCVNPMMTRDNYRNVSGRKWRNGNDWLEVQEFFDENLKPEYDWRDKFGGRYEWDEVLNSGKSYFDLSFGFYLYFDIPFKVLQETDRDNSNLSPLAKLLDEIKVEVAKILVE